MIKKYFFIFILLFYSSSLLADANSDKYDNSSLRKEVIALEKAIKLEEKRIKNQEWPKVSRGKKIELNSTSKRVSEVRARLKAEGYAVSPLEGEDKYDYRLEGAVKSFQEKYGMDADGIIGDGTIEAMNYSPQARIKQMQANLERLKNFKPDTNGRYINVNIPGFFLEVINNGKVELAMKIIAGRRDRKTPIFNDQIEHIVINPTWSVPKNIAVKDKLSKIQQDPSFLSRNGMKLYGKNTEGVVSELDPASVNWAEVNAENYNYTIIQRPGNDNALGHIKFIFPNKYDVYLHDTPSRSLFRHSVRTFSSGCIRIEKPLELATLLLKDENISKEEIETMIKRGSLKTIKLSQHVPVYLNYFTVWMEGKKLRLANDTYGYDKRAENIAVVR